MGTALYRALKAANVPDDLAVEAAAAATPDLKELATRTDLRELAVATKTDLRELKAELKELATKVSDLTTAVAKLQSRILVIALPIILSTIGIATGILVAFIIKWR